MMPFAVVVMGVSGSGKTTIANGVGRRLGLDMLEGDDFHSAENIAKMRHGIALGDADRWPWLNAIAAAIDAERAAGRSAIVACSALKRSYRDILIGARFNVALVYLRGSRALLVERVAHRAGHFMPPALLDSQFADLEEPAPDEHPIVVSVAPPPEDTVAAVVAALRRRWPACEAGPKTPALKD